MSIPLQLLMALKHPSALKRTKGKVTRKLRNKTLIIFGVVAVLPTANLVGEALFRL
jgi:nitrogen fixation/metabolism regulation signal transduction histidine kinase